MKSRVVILVFLFAGLFLALASRMFYLQVLPNALLEKLKQHQYMTVVSLPAQRGKILDRKGADLATSVTAQSLYADPLLIKTPKRISKRLSLLLGINVKDIYSLLTADRRFVWIKRRLDDDVVSEIKSWEEPGLRFVEEGKRAYPNQTLLSQVLGFVGTEGGGLEGLEKKYDEDLRGEKQAVVSRRDARGRPLVVSGQIFELHADGATIETTIDKDLQYELERELEKVTVDEQAEKAMGVIMDPSTGEVLAMGTYPNFDPVRPNQGNSDLRRNRVVTDFFEPGSTFKVVTVASALRTGRIKPNTKYFCENGSFKIGKRTIHEAEEGKKKGFGWLSLAEILEVSSNIGTTKVAFDVGQESFQKMIHDFGFGEKTGIDFPGEASGMLASGKWPEHLLSNISFGQGVGVTAIQMASAYSMIASGGKMYRPYLVRRVLDTTGRVLEEREPQVSREVLSPKEASTLTLMLSGVTQDGGTGTAARVDGYPVAGKTGTAQKVDPNGNGYIRKGYVSSFIGFVPANNPQFTIYVAVDHPKKHFFGAQVAAPIFNHLASFALHQRGFMPIVVSDAPVLTAQQAAQKESHPEGKGYKPNPILPTLVHTEAPVDPDIVPNFSGLTVREVAAILEKNKAHGEVQFLGTGVVSSQSLAPGKPWSKTQKMRVIFKPSG